MLRRLKKLDCFELRRGSLDLLLPGAARELCHSVAQLD